MQFTRALLSLALSCAPIILSAPIPQQSIQDALEGTGINRLQHANSSSSFGTGSLQQVASHAQSGNYKRVARPDPVQQAVTSSSKTSTTSTVSATSTTASSNLTSTSTRSASSTSATVTPSSHPLPGLTPEQQQEADQEAIINSGPNSITKRSTVQETMQSSGINDLQDNQASTAQQPGSLVDAVKNAIRPGSYARLFRRQRPIQEINASSGINDLTNSANSSMPTGQLATNAQAALRPGSGGIYRREDEAEPENESLEDKVSRLEEVIKRQATSIQNVLQTSGVNNMSSSDGGKNHNVPANSLLKPSGQ